MGLHFTGPEMAAIPLLAFAAFGALVAVCRVASGGPAPEQRPPGWLVEDVKAAWRRWRAKP